MIRVQRPPNVAPGSSIIVQDPAGRRFRAHVPPGVEIGGVFYVKIAADPPIAPPPPPVPVPYPLPQPANAPPRYDPELSQQEDEELARALAESLAMSFNHRQHEQTPEVQVASVSSVVPSAAEARQLMECSVCFDDLSSEPCAIFLNAKSRRVCMHMFHERCARELPTKCCPLCRADFATSTRLPSLANDPEAWFRAVDYEGDGRLSKAQVMQVMLTQFPLDVGKFEARMEEIWPHFDTRGSGYVTKEDFFAPNGLVQFARKNLSSLLRGATDLDASQPTPDIRTDRLGWFEYFNEDGTGKLAQEEIVRALIKTYALGSDLAQVRAMRERVGAVWAVFASATCVTREEFLRPDGLADTIIAELDPAMLRNGPQSSQGHAPATRLELPQNIKPCPACNMLLEKVSADDAVLCGCQSRKEGGSYELALAAGGCGHEFNFSTLRPLGFGRPGSPANEKQVNFYG